MAGDECLGEQRSRKGNMGTRAEDAAVLCRKAREGLMQGDVGAKTGRRSGPEQWPQLRRRQLRLQGRELRRPSGGGQTRSLWNPYSKTVFKGSGDLISGVFNEYSHREVNPNILSFLVKKI